ncbi:MAG: PIN domain-containing protein [Pseudomonadota bacterium]
MQSILVDTSIWVDFFRGGQNSLPLDSLIDDDLVVTNDLILAELLPHLLIRRQKKLASLLKALKQIPIDVDWSRVIDTQVSCLRDGANGIGIPDILIAHSATNYGCALWSLDKHFRFIRGVEPGLNLLA